MAHVVVFTPVDLLVFDSNRLLTLEVDQVILATGQGTDLACFEGSGVENMRGFIVADTQTKMTAVPGVFAGGDGQHGPRTALEALRYEQEIVSFHRTAAFPAIDLVLLGMGDNGHTASLFPGTAALREKKRKVVAQYVEVMTTWRVTFTAPFINAARHVAFMVEGAGKTDMLWNVLKGPYQPDVWPSQLIEPTGGELHWLLDAAAASRLVAR